MEVADARGKIIFKGAHVRYTGTGSAGEVTDIKSDDEGSWAKIDTTDLWYKSQFIELIEEDQYNKLKVKEVPEIEEEDVDEKEKIHGKVNKSRKKKIGEGVDMSSELCDGGG
jgi:hypothetical protein